MTVVLVDVANKGSSRKVNLQTRTDAAGSFSFPNVLDADTAWATVALAAPGERLDTSLTRTEPVTSNRITITWMPKPKNVFTYQDVVNRIRGLSIPFDAGSTSPVVVMADRALALQNA